MRTRSVYEFECECGKVLSVPEPVGTCPHCGRQYELHWGGCAPGEPIAAKLREEPTRA